MIVKIDGKNLSVDNQITIAELIELAREIADRYQPVTELRINGQTVSQSRLEKIKKAPISEFSESKLELFSTSVYDIILKVLDKAARYIERVKNARTLTDQDVREIIKSFQWLNSAIIQVNSYLDWGKKDQIKELVERNSNFCKDLNDHLPTEDKNNPHLEDEIRGELKPYLHLIDELKESIE